MAASERVVDAMAVPSRPGDRHRAFHVATWSGGNRPIARAPARCQHIAGAGEGGEVEDVAAGEEGGMVWLPWV